MHPSPHPAFSHLDCLPAPAPSLPFLKPFSLHLVLKPFNAEQSRQFVTAALSGAQVCALDAPRQWTSSQPPCLSNLGYPPMQTIRQAAHWYCPAGLQVPPEVAQLLWERSNGLPSFLEQLVVFLQARLASCRYLNLGGWAELFACICKHAMRKLARNELDTPKLPMSMCWPSPTLVSSAPCLPAAVCPDTDGGAKPLPQPHQRRWAKVGCVWFM